MLGVLGICASPARVSNTEVILKNTLESIKQEGVSVEILSIPGKKVECCRHCN